MFRSIGLSWMTLARCRLLAIVFSLNLTAAQWSPAAAPATQPADPVARAFANLCHTDPKVREAARIELMGLPRNRLPALEKIVADSVPLMPQQAAALKEIVTHAYLAGEEYESSSRDGFLGVRPVEAVVNFKPGPVLIDEDDRDAVRGVVIMERIPGFCGARWLQDGDVILGIAEKPTVEIRGVTEFTLAVRTIGAGGTVTFQVLRQGQVIQVPMVLDSRPSALEFAVGGPNPLGDLAAERKRRADDYWERAFAPLLKEGVG